jgi:prephenate dehydrogenase
VPEPRVADADASVSDTARAEVGRAEVIGTGLIGGSIGLALRARGWHVSGWDAHPDLARRAAKAGALDAVGPDPSASITFIATPAGAVIDEAKGPLAEGRVVTDVAGIKGPIVAGLPQPGFVGGHPMAGSEQEGIDGADADLFVGATWVLTPTSTTDAHAYATVNAIVTSLGANVVAVPPARHDDLVAIVSHVPHLTAASLMNLAADTALEHGTLLRLAAGGFRDMTRIAAGHPGIWPDVCADNRDAIVSVIDQLVGALAEVRAIVADKDRDGLLNLLNRARDARINLPVGSPPPSHTVEIRVPVPDRPAVLAEITTLLGELGVNIYDLEISHSVEGDRGVLILVVATTAVPVVREVLTGRGYRLSVHRMGQ